MMSVGGKRRESAGWWCALLGMGILLAACGPLPEAEKQEPGPQAETRVSMFAGHRRDSVDTEVSPPFGVDRPRLKPRESASRWSAVGWDGRQFLVVWRDLRPESGGMFAARVKPDGTVLDPAGIALDPGRFYGAGIPSVAFDGKQFVVVWLDDGIFGVHVSPEGKVLRSFTVISSGEVGGGAPALACNPELCLVGFSVDSDEGTATHVSRVSSEGTLLEPRLVRLSRGGEGDIVGEPSAAWDGHQFLVTWTDGRDFDVETADIYGARVLPDGTVLDPDGFPISDAPGQQRTSSVVWTDRRFLVVWADARGGDFDIRGARVHSSGRVEEPEGFPISTAPGDQRLPRIAHIGGRSLVVWEDARDPELRVRGAGVKEDTTVEDSGFLVSSGDFPDEGAPAVAAGKDRYFVSFASLPESPLTGSAILGTRVERDRDVKDRPALLLTRFADEQRSPVVAASDDEYLVVWRDFREPGAPALHAARVKPDGTVRDSKGIRLPASPEASDAVVASDGRDFLVVWSEPRAEGPALRGARVSRSGQVLDAAGVDIATGSGSRSSVQVASSGEGYLVVWREANGGATIRGARVTRGGAVLEPGGFRISPDPLPAFDPQVVHNGSHYLVVYGTFRRETVFDTYTGLRAVRVAEDGSVLDASSLVLAPERLDVSFRGVALASDGRDSLVVWSDFTRLYEDSGDLRMLRVSREGDVLEPEDPFVASGQSIQERPTVTFDGHDYVVAWQEATLLVLPGSIGFTVPDLAGARVSREGRVLERFPISTHPSEELGPSLASVGGGRSIVFYWEFLVAPDAMTYRVQGRVLRGP